MNLKKRLIHDSKVFSVSTIIVQCFSAVRSMIIPVLLGPYYYGLVNALFLIPEYTKSCHLGTLAALGAKIPMYLQQQKNKEVEDIKNNTFTLTIYVTGVVLFGMLLIYFFRKSHSLELSIGIIAIAIFILFQNIRVIINMILRSYSKFVFISKLNIIEAVCNLLITVSLVYFFKIYGIFMSMVIISASIVTYLLRKMRFKFRFTFDRQVISKLLKFGFPIFLLGISTIIFATIDRLFILKFLSTIELGYYAIGVTLIVYIQLIPASIAKVLAPRFYEESGKMNPDHGKLFFAPTMIIAFLSMLIIGIVYFTFPLLMLIFLPQYQKGIIANQILIFAAFFSSIVLSSFYLLISLGKRYEQLLMRVFTLVLAVGIYFWFLRLDMGIRGIALATVISNFIFAVILLFYSSLLLTKKIMTAVKFVVKILSIFLFALFIIKALDYLFPVELKAPLMEIGRFNGIKLIIFLIAQLPLVIYFEKKYNVLRYSLGKIRPY